VAVLGKRKVIGDFAFKTQTAEPAIRQVQMSLFAQPTFGTNALAVAHHQQANHQFGINRWTPDWAIKIGEIMTQIA
jgi:hypothetical protein